jgi:TRAP-type C4-dicarboxylate transport system substrate-binding protein
MKQFKEQQYNAKTNFNFGAIQAADMEAWQKFIDAGIEINRLGSDDLERFQEIAVPIWFEWANKDKDAARIFKLQLEIMENPTVGYVTPDMYQGLSINL